MRFSCLTLRTKWHEFWHHWSGTYLEESFLQGTILFLGPVAYHIILTKQCALRTYLHFFLLCFSILSLMHLHTEARQRVFSAELCLSEPHNCRLGNVTRFSKGWPLCLPAWCAAVWPLETYLQGALLMGSPYLSISVESKEVVLQLTVLLHRTYKTRAEEGYRMGSLASKKDSEQQAACPQIQRKDPAWGPDNTVIISESEPTFSTSC